MKSSIHYLIYLDEVLRKKFGEIWNSWLVFLPLVHKDLSRLKVVLYNSKELWMARTLRGSSNGMKGCAPKCLTFWNANVYLLHFLYLYFVVVFCCFGHLNKQTNSLTLKIFIPQAFEANASSSGGILTSIDIDINQDVKITTMKSESHSWKKRGKVKFGLRLSN